MSDTEKSAQAQPNESAEPSFRYNAKLAQDIERDEDWGPEMFEENEDDELSDDV